MFSKITMASTWQIKDVYKTLRESWLFALVLFVGAWFITFFALYPILILPLNILLPSIFANLVVLLFQQKRIWFFLGLNFDWTGVRMFLEGILLPLLVFIPILLLILPFGVSINPNFAVDDFALRTFEIILFAAVSEELVFRGILFQTALDKKSETVVTLAFSGSFALLHLPNPNINIIGLINIFLAGIVLSAMFLRTYSLWLPIGFHFGWNFWQSVILDSPISGTYFGLHIFQTKLTEFNQIIFGGNFGIEGGIVGSLALCIFCLITFKRFKPIPHIYSRILRERYSMQ
jgi:membrane protease YdiL (CAAX protease family)